MPTSPPNNEILQTSGSIKREKPKSKLYETLQKVRRNTFNSSKDEEDRNHSKSPPVSAGSGSKTKPKLPNRGSVNEKISPEKSPVPVFVVSSPSPITIENDAETELFQIGKETSSSDSIHDPQEMPQNNRRSNLYSASDMDIEVPGTPILRESTRNNFTHRFPEIEEPLLQYHSCAWERDILWQGRLYITKSTLCFYAKIFGNEVKLLLKFSDITSIDKSVVVGLIPNSITIFSKGQRYFFASFMKRDNIYDYLHCLWTNSKDCDCSNLKTELRLDTELGTPSTIASANASAVSSAITQSLPPLPRKKSKFEMDSIAEAPVVDLKLDSSLVVFSKSSIKNAGLALVIGILVGVILRYFVWTGAGRSVTNEREQIQFQKQMHLEKVYMIAETMSQKNLLIQQKLAGLESTSLP